MMKQPFSRRFARKALRCLSRLLLKGFTRTRTAGLEHFPAAGPVIIAGNHAGLMELVLLVALLPLEAEFIGSGDIPLDPRFAWLAELWGYIPVKRGVLDRDAIRAASGVLKNGGALVIFPEGGIWNPGAMQPHAGVALLSKLAHTPVLPVGMSGTQGALADVLRLKRPSMLLSVGELIPPVPETPPDESQKKHLEQYATLVMESIRELIPAAEEPEAPQNERYTFELEQVSGGVKQPQDVPERFRQALGKFLLHPIILDIFRRNLKLPVEVLMRLDEKPPADEIAQALDVVLRYLQVNPGLLTYRFGMDEGLTMREGLEWLKTRLDEISAQGGGVVLRPMQVREEPDGSVVVQERYLPPGRY